MNAHMQPGAGRGHRRGRVGSVLIIVLWVAFGLVALTLYFAHTMTFELRSADNQVAAIQADAAIAGAVRYVTNLLATSAQDQPGVVPQASAYLAQEVALGDARFWLIGRNDQVLNVNEPAFGLVDEASKLNLNTATAEMLQLLPRMTPELAAAIIDWRDTNSTPETSGAEDEIYQRLNPPYRCKNSDFESVDELRLLYGMTQEILYGEDPNANGLLDPGENDGDDLEPEDNRDGRLDPGILEYVTVWSQEPTTRTNGEARINVASTNQAALASLLQEKFGTDRANQILQQVGAGQGGGGGGGGGGQPTGTPVGSVLEFFMRSGMTTTEFAEIEADLTTSEQAPRGLVNVNTASEAVLACLPGIGLELAPSVVSYRQSNPDQLNSVAWAAEVLGETNAVIAGPYLTGHSYQYAADVAAVGNHGRGYRRARFVIDITETAPRLLYRQDLSHLGWALGSETRRLLNSDLQLSRR